MPRAGPTSASASASAGPGAAAAAPDRALLAVRLDAGLAALGEAIDAAIDADARARLLDFVALLAHWNRAFNLTAVRDPAEMVPRHLLDSLAVLPWLDPPRPGPAAALGPVLDLGTGAGLPGIPLAIARPDLAFTLLDANGKKTRFVRQATAALGLGHCTVVQARAESYRPPGNFATIVARAVAPLAELIAVSRPLAAPGARLLALKGRPDAAGLAAPTGAPIRVHRLRVPGLDAERHLIEVPLDSHPHG